MKNSYNKIQDFLDDLHEEISIHDAVIEMGLVDKNDFKKANFISCIFHDGDRTPSLQISTKFWKCYACGAKGDLVNFVKMYYNTDFYDAVKKIANFYNININSFNYHVDERYKKLSDEWNRYLKNMQNADKKIKELQRDYFPQEVGFDNVENYIVFPITSRSNSILGFTKRRIDFLHETDNNNDFYSPKWKHSKLSDSLINLCHNIFNLGIASSEMKKKQEVIITEGPKDVIAYRRIGHNNTICSCGTGNSSNIWDEILPIKKIILSMDGDKAGIKATLDNILYLSPIYDIKNVYVVNLPEGKDPYDISSKELEEAYSNLSEAIPFFIKHADIDRIKELIDSTPEYNNMYIMKNICKIKGFSISETESWLFSSDSRKIKKDIEQMTEKEKLLAIVNCEDKNLPLIPIEKAKRILKLKYGISC